jgi:apolipoprotein N-acyltransferase
VKGTVPLVGELTFYARHGQWLVWMCGVPGAALFLIAWLRRRTL